MQTLNLEFEPPLLRERSFTFGGGGGGGSGLFKRLGPKNFGPLRVNSPKILAPFKMWAQKIVTLPCQKNLRIRMLHRDKPYECYFETMSGFSESESCSNASDDNESSDQDNLSSINDSKDGGRIVM